MEQQLVKQTVTFNNIQIPSNKLYHHYHLLHEKNNVLKSTALGGNTSCYATFYNFKNGVFYEDLIGIEQVVTNQNNIPAEIFEKCLREFTSIYEMHYEYEFNKELDVHYFKIVFGKNPNMGRIKMVLDSVRYLWECTYIVPFSQETFNFELTGRSFAEYYYNYVDVRTARYGGHDKRILYVFKKIKDIDLLFDTVEKYPDGNETVWLSRVFSDNLKEYNIDSIF